MTAPISPQSTGPPRDGAAARIAKPWGEELILSRSPDAVCKLLRINPGQRLSLQYHCRKRETILVLSGEAVITLGPTIDQLRTQIAPPGFRQEIPPRAIHRFAAREAPVELLEVATGDGIDAADIVRLADDFGRARLP